PLPRAATWAEVAPPVASMPQLRLSFELGRLDLQRAEQACFDCGAMAVTLSDCRDDAVLEPMPGEVRIWPETRVQALFADGLAAPALVRQLAGALRLPAASIAAAAVPDR